MALALRSIVLVYTRKHGPFPVFTVGQKVFLLFLFPCSHSILHYAVSLLRVGGSEVSDFVKEGFVCVERSRRSTLPLTLSPPPSHPQHTHPHRCQALLIHLSGKSRCYSLCLPLNTSVTSDICLPMHAHHTFIHTCEGQGSGNA